MIILTDEELTYVVEATGEGEFNLTVDRDLQNVRYIADYYDVNITSNSTSNLDVSDANPEFIMEVDYDGDGTSDYAKYPDNLEIITYNQADIYATMFNPNYDQGDTLSSRIYVENSGQGAIDDILRISITDPYGEKVYGDLKPIYIESDEMESFKISWTVPSDALEGLYKLRVEFDDWDIDALPRVRWFNVGTATTNTPQITITSPQDPTTDTTPDLNLTTDELANVTYSWDSEASISGCRNCTAYSTSYGENNGSDPSTVLLMHMNENYGTTAYDDALNNNGVINDATWAAGRFGRALDFDGTGDYIEVADNASIDFNASTDSFTIMAWINPAGATGTSQFIVNKQTGLGFDPGIHLFLKKTGELRFMIHTTELNSDYGDILGTTNLSGTGWRHIVAVYDASADTMDIYVDGNNDSVAVNYAPTASSLNNDPLFIGAYGPSDRYFNGAIDEVVIYSRVLSQAEIQELYSKTLSAGQQHSVTVWATDVNGSQNSATRWFNVD